jgi:hypothetical protein
MPRLCLTTTAALATMGDAQVQHGAMKAWAVPSGERRIVQEIDRSMRNRGQQHRP